MDLDTAYLNMSFPWILLPVIAIYLLKSQRKARAVCEGSIKALLGYYMVVIAAGVTPLTTGPVSQLMHAAFGVEGGVMNSEVYGALLLVQNAALGFLLMFLAFGLNLLLARFTRLKGVFLTTHHYLYLSLFTVAVLRAAGLNAAVAVLVGAVVLSIYGWLSVAATRGIIAKTTGMQDVGMANSSAEAALLGGICGYITGDYGDGYSSKSETRRPLIGSIPVAACLSTFVTLAVLCAFAGQQQAREILGEGALLVNCGVRALLYGAQLMLLLYGIRHLLASVIEMHWKLADRFVPGIWKGLDVSVMISYKPRAWEEGFLFSCAGGMLATVLMICFRMPFVPIVSLSSFYFFGGLAGVCGYAYGKRRGARLAGFAAGVLATAAIGLMAASLPVETDMGVIFGETQYGIFGLILQGIAALLRG